MADNSRKIENEWVEFIIKNDIMYSIHKPNVHVTEEIARACVELRLELSEGKTYPMYTDLRGISSVNKAARTYLRSGESIRGVSAGAFLVKNIFQKSIFDFFILVARPPIPAKYFTEEAEAIFWLEKYLQKHLN